MLSERADELIDACDYPATCEEVQEAVGDERLELPNDTEPLAEAIGLGGGEVFESAEDVQLAVYNGVGGGAVGRRRYSDRDPGTPGTDDVRRVSF